MSLSTFSGSISIGVTWNAQNDLTGGDYGPVKNVGGFTRQRSFSSAIANASLGGADQFVSYILSIAAGASATIDLTALTNILQQASVTVARIKAIIVRLLDTTDDATNGTLCTGASFGQLGGAITDCFEGFQGGGSGLTINVTAAAGAITVAAVVAGGTGYPKSATFLVAVVQSTATGGLLAATTNSSGVVTSVAIVNGGSGYTTATPLATFTISWNTLGKGAGLGYNDDTTAGFVVDSTHKNVRIQNNDAVVAAAFQFTVVCGGT